MDFTETPEHQLLRESVHSIGAEFGHDYYMACTEQKRFTEELWQAVFSNGFGGVNLPERYGGGGGGMQEVALVVEELAAVGCPLPLLIIACMNGPVIDEFGTDEQKQRWLPGLAAGTTRMAFAITEVNAGSNFRRMETTATRDAGKWVINGTKQFITCIDVADSVLVVCRTGSDERGRAQLSLFVVETDAPGLSMSPIRMELRVPDRHSSVYFDDVIVPDENLIGGVPHQAARQVFSSLNPERITVAAQAVGLARYFLGKAVAYAKQRTVWDEPIGAHQAVAHPLAEAKIATDLAQLMTVKAAWLSDHGLDAGAAAGVAKLAAADAALAALDQAIQVHGGSGLATESGLADLWGLTRLMRVAPVSKEMVLNHVSQHVLGLPRSY